MSETIKLELFEHPEGADMSRASDKRVWHPSETLRGRVIVQSAARLLVERLVVHLEGSSVTFRLCGFSNAHSLKL